MTVMIDDYLPQFKHSDGDLSTVYAKLGPNVPLWGALLEKAFAKRYGNYEHISEGVPSEAIRALTGAPYISYEHSEMTESTIWDLIEANDPVDDFLVAGTEMMDEDFTSELPGVAPNHAFTILGTHTLTKDGTKLIKLRNPWGTPGFHGTWSGSRFDAASKKEIGYKDGDDGIFFVDLETYKMAFTETSISLNSQSMASARFLKTLDESQAENPGKWVGVCGPKCTRHELTLKSDVDQTVYVTAYTWGRKSVPDECE